MLTRKNESGERTVVGRGHSKGKPETPEYGKMVARMIRAYGKRVADADEIDLGQMLTMRDELDAAIVAAVHGQRTKWGRSWGYIAEGAGLTRQAAQQRWGKAVNELSEKLAESNESSREIPTPPGGWNGALDRERAASDEYEPKHRASV